MSLAGNRVCYGLGELRTRCAGDWIRTNNLRIMRTQQGSVALNGARGSRYFCDFFRVHWIFLDVEGGTSALFCWCGALYVGGNCLTATRSFKIIKPYQRTVPINNSRLLECTAEIPAAIRYSRHSRLFASFLALSVFGSFRRLWLEPFLRDSHNCEGYIEL